MSHNARAKPITNPEAFEHLYKQGRDRLQASLTGLVRDRDRAEDLAETAFQTAWEKRAQFRGDSLFGTWLYAIARNAARGSWWQERSNQLDPVDRLETPRYAEPDRLSARLEEDELRTLVCKTLARIPVKSRRLLIDRYVNELSIQEIARREGVPIGTVGSRIFTAKRLLRGAWQTPTAVGDAVQEEKVRQIADEALKRLVDELQAGRSDALTQYLAAMGRFHRYSWNNVMLIHAQRPEATRVAGYHTWQQAGRWVKRGEKGIMIIAPLVTKSPDRDGRATGEKLQQQPELVKVAGFRTAFVFDVEQTEGRPLPALVRTGGDPRDFGDKLKVIVAQRGIALTYDASIAPADGLSSGGQIRLRPGLSPSEEFSVLAHELAHEILHHGADRGTLSKTVRETQAEAVAFVVSRGIGLETRSAAADYIALYNGDAKTLAESLATIQDTSTQILSELLPDERTKHALERASEADRAMAATDRQAADASPDRSGITPPTETPTLDR